MTLTLTHDQLRQFEKSDERFRHPACDRMRYTLGVKFLADHGAFHSILNIIVCYFDAPEVVAAAKVDPRIASAQLWQLNVGNRRSATLTVSVGAEEPVILTRPVLYTSCPLEHVDVWAIKQGYLWSLCLPSEL